MQKFLKSAAVVVAMALVGTAAFAADVKASVYMEGDLYGTNGFKVANANQKDSDMLEINVSGDKSGAQMKLWTDLSGDSSTVHMRSAALWFKPFDMLKVSVGNVGSYLYTEQLNWWKVPTGASAAQASSWDHRWSSFAGIEAGGINFELTPVEGLFVAAGVAPGFGNTIVFDNTLATNANTDLGLVVKYNIAGFGSVGAAYRNEGANEPQLIRLGADFNAVPGLYGFVQAIAFMDNTNAAYAGADAQGYMLRGIAIDNYFKYTADKLTVAARFPVTVRLAGDSSYLTYRVKASYAADGFTPYFSVETVDYVPLQFADVANTITATIQPGVAFSVEKANLDVSLKVNVQPNTDISWSIPFTARVSF